jgi:hypothetical protein
VASTQGKSIAEVAFSPKAKEKQTPVTLNPKYDMNWARRILDLDERRVRSPSRSLLTLVGKVGLKR